MIVLDGPKSLLTLGGMSLLVNVIHVKNKEIATMAGSPKIRSANFPFISKGEQKN
jgi:hypothetical protein